MLLDTTIIATLCLAVILLAVRKKYFMVPFMIAACFIPADQRIIIFDLDFTTLRLLVLVGFIRIIFRLESLKFRLNHFDKLIFLWAFCGAIVYVIQWGDMRALINRCGFLFDVIGLYWLFRLNINSWSDIKLIIKTLAISSLILGVLVAIEWKTGQNPFIILGRVRTSLREGRYRCQASFPHSIILGLFWVTIVPIFIGYARTEKNKNLYWLAIAASIFIVAATASSTPYLTLIIVIIIMCMYKWRQYAKTTIWICIMMLVVFQIFMTQPVWSLISKMSVVPGSTGMHRFNLINGAINHINEWAILGTRNTSHWGHGLNDITNQYIIEGVQGGLITLIIFLLILYNALKFLLHLSLSIKDSKQRFLLWSFFVAIIGNCISFLGVSYFGQIVMLWYIMLATVSFFYSTKQYRERISRQYISHQEVKDDLLDIRYNNSMGDS